MQGVTPQASFAAPGYGAGARVAPITAVLPADGTGCTVYMSGMPPGQSIGAIATLYIDNSDGPIPITVLWPDTGMSIDVAAYTQGFYQTPTAGQNFTVSAPLMSVLGVSFSVPIQAINVPVSQGQPVTTLPLGNTGVVDSVGNPAGWTSFAFDVPGTNTVYTALEIDNGAYSAPVTISSTDGFGNPWSVTVPGFTRQEFSIPPTAAGEAATATTATPVTPYSTTALIPTRWRVAPAGVATSTTLPSSTTSFSESFPSPASGNTSFNLALPSGFGAYVSGVQIFAQGLVSATNEFDVFLVDNSGTSPPANNMWAGVFEGGTWQFAAPVGYATKFRGGNITLTVDAAAAFSAGAVLVQLQFAPVAGSQNG